MEEPRKLVNLRKSTYDKLTKLGTAGDSLNDVIEDLLRTKNRKLEVAK